MNLPSVIKCLKILIFKFKFLYKEYAWINKKTFITFQKMVLNNNENHIQNIKKVIKVKGFNKQKKEYLFEQNI